MSVYSNQKIRQAIANDHIICHPFKERNISGNSLEVTLGFYYYRTASASNRTIYNPFDHEDVERFFDGPYKALLHKEWCRLYGYKPVAGIPDAHPVIALKPGERILAHSHEFIGVRTPRTAEMRSMGFWNDNGISVCYGSAPIGQEVVSRIRLDILNTNQQELVLLPVGEPIAQFVFNEVEQTGEDETEHIHLDVETAIKTWSPNLLVPSLRASTRNLPEQIKGLSYE